MQTVALSSLLQTRTTVAAHAHRYSNVIVCKADNEIVQCAYQVGGCASASCTWPHGLQTFHLCARRRGSPLHASSTNKAKSAITQHHWGSWMNVFLGWQVGGKMSSLRLVQQGRTYQLPPITSGIPPSAQEPLDSWRSNVTQAAQLAVAPPPSHSNHSSTTVEEATTSSRSASSQGASSSGNGRQRAGSNGSSSKVQPARQPSIGGGLVRAYTGTSPTLVWELCNAAGVDSAAAPDALDAAAWSALYDQWLGWQERVASGGFAASLDASNGRRVTD